MPLLKIHTNVQASKAPDDFHKVLNEKLATLLNKPKEGIAIMLNTDKNMSFGGKTDPCILAYLTALNVFDPQKNRVYAKEISSYLSTSLGVLHERIRLVFNDPGPTNVVAGIDTVQASRIDKLPPL